MPKYDIKSVIIFLMLLMMIYMIYKVDKIEKREEFAVDEQAFQNIASVYSNGELTVTNLNVTDSFNMLPSGTILPYLGDGLNIPSGWALCDGQNGTPDLRNRFLLGTDTQEKLNERAGEFNRKIEERHLPPHSHDVSARGSFHTYGNWQEYEDRHKSLNDGYVKNPCLRLTRMMDYRPLENWNGDPYHNLSIYTHNKGNGVSFDTYPPYHKVNYIIKL